MAKKYDRYKDQHVENADFILRKISFAKEHCGEYGIPTRCKMTKKKIILMMIDFVTNESGGIRRVAEMNKIGKTTLHNIFTYKIYDIDEKLAMEVFSRLYWNRAQIQCDHVAKNRVTINKLKKNRARVADTSESVIDNMNDRMIHKLIWSK